MASLPEAPYMLPNPTGTAELSRLDLQHEAFVISLAGLQLAELPTPHPKLVLDLGCGSGSWAHAFASAHPESIVIGADIAPPTHHPILANLAFVKADATSDWSPIYDVARKLQTLDSSDDIKFDYVYIRLMTYALRKSTWLAFFKIVADNIAHGGLLEVADSCLPRGSNAGFDSSNSSLVKLMQLISDGSSRLEVELEADKTHPERLKQAGFEVVKQKVMQWRSGAWGEGDGEREIGRLMAENAKLLIHAAPDRARKLHIEGEEEEEGGWDGLAARAGVELEQKMEKLQLYSTMVIFVARKI